jgi:hypothetical protein
VETEAFLGQLQAAMTSNDQAAIGTIMSGMQARWKSATNKGWAAEITGGAPGGGVKPFESRDEMVRAQQDPLYKSGDETAHLAFDRRLARSKELKKF